MSEQNYDRMITRMAHLSGAQLAEKILRTDRAVYHDRLEHNLSRCAQVSCLQSEYAAKAATRIQYSIQIGVQGIGPR